MDETINETKKIIKKFNINCGAFIQSPFNYFIKIILFVREELPAVSL